MRLVHTRLIYYITLLACSTYSWCGIPRYTNQECQEIRDKNPNIINSNVTNVHAYHRLDCYKKSSIENAYSDHDAYASNSHMKYLQTVKANLRNTTIGYLYLQQKMHDTPRVPLESTESSIRKIYINNLYRNDVQLIHIDPKEECSITFGYKGGIVRTNMPHMLHTKATIQELSKDEAPLVSSSTASHTLQRAHSTSDLQQGRLNAPSTTVYTPKTHPIGRDGMRKFGSQ